MSIVEMIQSMLAPGIMISACGLLLLGMNNKYSVIVNRIRVLDEEKRKLKLTADEGKLMSHHEKRQNSLNKQMKVFSYRIRLVRNAVVFYSIAVAFFILACLAIGLNFATQNVNIANAAIVLFLLGMLSVFSGVTFACLEVIKGYQIVQIEIRES